MIKSILKEIYNALDHLNDCGYFETEQKPKVKRKHNTHRGPDRGVRRKGNKLFPKDVLEIYNDNRSSYDELAEIFDVTTSTIYDIKTGHTWSKVTGHK